MMERMTDSHSGCIVEARWLAWEWWYLWSKVGVRGLFLILVVHGHRPCTHGTGAGRARKRTLYEITTTHIYDVDIYHDFRDYFSENDRNILRHWKSCSPPCPAQAQILFCCVGCSNVYGVARMDEII